jgi:hypothetical protein
MHHRQDLVDAATTILGPDDPVLAAGIFGLQDQPVAVGAASVAGAAAGRELDGALGAGLGGAVAIHTTREALAASQGLTVRMLVAVTATRIHVLDWVTGSGPTRELLSFDRSTTRVQVTTFGLSRRLHLADPTAGSDLALTGTTALFSAEAPGDKAVLRELAPT